MGGTIMRYSTAMRRLLVSGTALAALGAFTAGTASAQETQGTTQPAATPTGAETPKTDATVTEAAANNGEILVTGSRIRQNPNNSALPLQIITNDEVQRNGISSPEQLLMYLTTNGSGADNLASNSDVVTGAQRGTNGLSAANLRGQGSAATLVLLNGRRVAAHGLSGSAVDVNQIPFAVIDRVEVLKDGASAIYGTDAVGGVINFITRKDYQGFGVQGLTDITQEGNGNIYRVSATAGYGDIRTQGFNVMGAVSYSWNQILRGNQRSFVNGNQPNRGLSIDTRGTPIATIFNIGASANQPPNGVTNAFGTGTLTGGLTLTAPNGANAAGGGINILDLPGGAGCGSVDGGMDYDYDLWQTPTAYYACSWDTGRAAVIQQPIKTLTYYGRGMVNIASSHQLSLEITGSKADSAKSFSNAQLSANATNLPIGLPLNANTAGTYNNIFSSLLAAFPTQQAGLRANYGKPIAYRWRCIPCGPREYDTTTKTFRAALGLEGPLWSGWDYRAGASYARSEASSVLGSGYYFRGTLSDNPATAINENGLPDPLAPQAPGSLNGQRGLVGVLNSGLINPFSLTQSDAGLAALAAVSAEGTTLYGGRYQVRQFDASASGPLFPLFGRDIQLAVGVDYRRETYEFNGSPAAAATAPVIFLAAFDNVNALTPKTRNVKAAYAEMLVPILDNLDITGAVRIDDYTGFGSTTNPKVSIKYRPFRQLLFRGSYNTSFRVPTFNQIFNGVTVSPYLGSDIADPVKCPGGVPTAPLGSGLPCAQIRPDIGTGGNPELGPETAKQFNVGVVLTPAPRFSASVDWWSISVDNTIAELTTRQLIQNGALFPERLVRDAAGNITALDQRWINAGARRTQGLEIVLRGGFDAFGGQILVGLDGTYLLRKKEKLTQAAPYSPSEVGVFTFTGDLGLKWKHNAFISYSNDMWSATLTQIFRDGYKNFALPGIASGAITRPDYNTRVSNYIVYNLSLSYNGLGPRYRITAGVKNLFDRDPPFAITYDGNTGAGSSWEPRVADPRGRSFTVAAEVKF
jgi:iron complex outermembrane receptor protein